MLSFMHRLDYIEDKKNERMEQKLKSKKLVGVQVKTSLMKIFEIHIWNIVSTERRIIEGATRRKEKRNEKITNGGAGSCYWFNV